MRSRLALVSTISLTAALAMTSAPAGFPPCDPDTDSCREVMNNVACFVQTVQSKNATLILGCLPGMKDQSEAAGVVCLSVSVSVSLCVCV
jgi:hypothetical protein